VRGYAFDVLNFGRFLGEVGDLAFHLRPGACVELSPSGSAWAAL
jgi:hypothetical protein